MKVKYKIIYIILLISLIISITNTSYGFGIENLKGTGVATSELKQAGNNIVGVITAVGVVVSVIVLIIIGIKYMMGSVEEKAEYKRTLMPYIIGAACVFATSVFVQLIYELAIKL